MYAYVQMCMYVHVCACVHVQMHVYMYVCGVYVCKCVSSVYVCMCSGVRVYLCVSVVTRLHTQFSQFTSQCHFAVGRHHHYLHALGNGWTYHM